MPCSNTALFLCAPSKRLHLEFMIKGCVASYRLSENIHHGHWRTTKGKLSCKFLRVLIGQLVTVTKFTEIPDQSSPHLRLALTELGNMSTLGHRSTFAYQKLDHLSSFEYSTGWIDRASLNWDMWAKAGEPNKPVSFAQFKLHLKREAL